MMSLPATNMLPFLLKGLRKAPAELFLPDFSSYPKGFRVGWPVSATIIHHPELVHHFLGKENKNLSKNISATRHFQLALGSGLATTFGDEWLNQKRKFQPSFSAKNQQEHRCAIEQTIGSYINELKNTPLKNWQNLQRCVLYCLLDLNWHQLFGSLFPGDKKALAHYMFRGNRLLALAAADNIPVVQQIVRRNLKQCRAGLRAAVEPALKQQQPKGEIKTDEVINLLMAGAITTAGNLLFCLLQLAGKPEEQHQFRNNANYRQLCLLESLRLYPSVWSLWYQAAEDMEHAGVQIRGNELLVFNLYALHRHPDFWDRPLRFLPQRFSNPAAATGCYLPFGHGPRKCIGQNLAVSILSVFLHKLFSAFTFHLPAGIGITPAFGAILYPKAPAHHLTFQAIA